MTALEQLQFGIANRPEWKNVELNITKNKLFWVTDFPNEPSSRTEFFTLLAAALKECTCPQLYFGCGYLGGHACSWPLLTETELDIIFEGIDQNTSFRELSLFSNTVNTATLSRLGMMLSKDTASIEKLNLSNCWVSSEALISFAGYLPNIKCLKTLELRNNSNIGSSEPLSSLGNGLSKNNSVEYLDLGSCNIKDKGITSFAKHIPNLNVLKGLGLCKNKFTAVGFRALVKGLDENDSLTNMDFSKNNPCIRDHWKPWCISSGEDIFGNEIPKIPRFSKNGHYLTEEERAKIAKRMGLCVKCERVTHSTGLFRRPLTNEYVSNGSCLTCNSDKPSGGEHGETLKRKLDSKLERNLNRVKSTGESSGELRRHETISFSGNDTDIRFFPDQNVEHQ